MNILIILSHPNLQNSLANREIVSTVQQSPLLSEVHLAVRHLDALYPGFRIDVRAEQQALTRADVIVFQHPMYWYATPASLKHWMDQVLLWGFAFGEGGDKLKDKYFIHSVTVGGSAESYRADGYNHFDVVTLLCPVEQTALLCGMRYAGLVHSHRNFYFPEKWNSRSEVASTAREHAERLIERLVSIVRPEARIRTFVQCWFERLNVLDETGFFLQYLDAGADIHFPEGRYTGPEGFKAWYEGTREKIVAPVSHELGDIQVRRVNDDRFEIRFPVRVKALDPAGRPVIDQMVNEEWTLSWDPLTCRPTILSYCVELDGGGPA